MTRTHCRPYCAADGVYPMTDLTLLAIGASIVRATAAFFLDNDVSEETGDCWSLPLLVPILVIRTRRPRTRTSTSDNLAFDVEGSIVEKDD